MRKADGAVLLDANLLVLLVVGSVSRSLIARHKKTRAFTSRDFDRLIALLGDRPIVIVPHVAAEASNLLCFHPEPERRKVLDGFRMILAELAERYVQSRQAAATPEFRFLGLTDAALLLCPQDAEIVTADALLHVQALKRGLSATNFNHLR